jgi:hypothetical protein
MLLLVSVLGLALPAVSYADTVFNFDGVLTDGGTVHGTITMNLTAGKVTAANFTVVDGSSYLFNTVSDPGGTGNFPTSENIFTTFVTSEFVLNLPVSTKVGYSGGNVCSDSVICIDIPAPGQGTSTGRNRPSAFEDLKSGASVIDLASGTMDLASGTMVTPEPSSFLFLETGMLSAAAMLRRKLIARS